MCFCRRLHGDTNTMGPGCDHTGTGIAFASTNLYALNVIAVTVAEAMTIVSITMQQLLQYSKPKTTLISFQRPASRVYFVFDICRCFAHIQMQL